ncbi:MAG: TatD family hydrolase [Dehalococcoidia bacterium]
MMLFDTHCHLQDPAFDDVDAVIERAAQAGVIGMAVCGYDMPSSRRATELASIHSGVLATVGIHPHDAESTTDAQLDELRILAKNEHVVGVGELGLDFYRDLSPRARQVEVLEAQLALALEMALPICVHSRGAEDAIGDQLRRYAEASPLRSKARHPGVMHCFGGTLEQARGFVDLGFLVSVACTVTYPKSDEGRRIARELPIESLVVETDSPYLPPQERRGKRNEPGLVGAAVTAIAAVRGMDTDEVARRTTENALRLYGVAAPATAGANAR